MKIRDRLYLIAIWLMPFAALASCTKTVEVEVIKTVPVEVKVPVATSCVVNRPTPPTALRNVVTPEEWRGLTTDQRENLLAAQGMNRKAYQDRLEVSTAGCR